MRISDDWNALESRERKTPELALWRSVLERAIRDFIDPELLEVSNGTSKEQTVALLKRSTRSWFKSDEDNIGSFRWICDALWPDSDMRTLIVKRLNAVVLT